MLAVVLVMFLCIGLALAVLVVVAVPARRAGRDVLTERGEEVVGTLRERAHVRRHPGAHGRRVAGPAREKASAGRA